MHFDTAEFDKAAFDTVLFDTVLVANRGEIARRILRTLRDMGLASVAVFSDADADAPHVREADEAVRLGPAPSVESYLNQDAVIRAAQATGAQAVHPGYGFLAENADFAERCAAEGLVFIGPSPEAIRAMGDKAAAKALAAEVGVPVLDGFPVDDLDGDALHRRAADLGFPLLLKATAGGGGKGMRTVSGPDDLDAAVDAARREAEGAFGDGALIVERLVVAPRHVEIQVFGDAHGGLVHLGERDCSVQRRHQKVFEESPSPAVDDALRARMGEAALALAKAVNYQGAGTVEFLLDAAGEFYFLEMNTRLQVEHPVTECVTGLDLVRLQVQVAQGEPLGFDQDAVALTGHALEARLYAEDPSSEFLPATGTVALWSIPEMPGLRVDSGVEPGSAVGIHYDPMLAKVIAHGRDRSEALRRLRRGLAELAVGGLVTNREFLLDVLDAPAFQAGEATTAFIEEHLPAERRGQAAGPKVLTQHALAAALHRIQQRRCTPGPLPAGIPLGWRNNRWRPQDECFEGPDGPVAVHYVASGQGLFTMGVTVGEPLEEATEAPLDIHVRLDTRGRRVDSTVGAHGTVSILEIDGVRRRFRVAEGPGGVSVHGLGRVTDLRPVPRFPERGASAVAGGCVAPMTGKVVEVPVEEGQRVRAGDTLVVLEAMKMEHRLQAQADGVVESVRVEAGQMVDPDNVLVVVTPEDGA